MPILGGIFSRKKSSSSSIKDGTSAVTKQKLKKQSPTKTSDNASTIPRQSLDTLSNTTCGDDDYSLPPLRSPFAPGRQRGASTGSNAGPYISSRSTSGHPDGSVESLISSTSKSPRRLPPTYNQTRQSFELPPNSQVSPIRLVTSTPSSRHDDGFGPMTPIRLSSPSSSQLVPPPQHPGDYHDDKSKGERGSSRSTRTSPPAGVSPSPNRPNSPSTPSRIHSPPITSAHRPTSPLAHEYKDTSKSGGSRLFSWVRERKKSAISNPHSHSHTPSATAPESPRTRTSSSATDLLPSFATSFTASSTHSHITHPHSRPFPDDEPPTPASVQTFASSSTTTVGPSASTPLAPQNQRNQSSGSGRGFVPPIRPNPRAKLSSRDKQDDASSFNLKSFRHVTPGASGPSLLETTRGRSSSPAPQVTQQPPVPLETPSRSRHNSFGSESSMTAGAFRQAMRKSATHLPLPGQSPSNNSGIEGAASRSSGYLPLPAGDSPGGAKTYNVYDKRGHIPPSAAGSSSSFLPLPTLSVGDQALQQQDKLSSSPASAGSRMSFSDTPWAVGRLGSETSPPAQTAKQIQPRKPPATPPRPPRVNPPPGRHSISPSNASTASKDDPTPARSATFASPVPILGRKSPTPLYKTSKAPRRLVSSSSSMTTTTSEEEGSGEEDSDDAPLGLRIRANGGSKGVGRKSTITQRSRASAANEMAKNDEGLTLRGKGRPSLIPQKQDLAPTKSDIGRPAPESERTRKYSSIEIPSSYPSSQQSTSPSSPSGHVVPPPRSSSLFPSTFHIPAGKGLSDTKTSPSVSTPPRSNMPYANRNASSAVDLLNHNEAPGTLAFRKPQAPPTSSVTPSHRKTKSTPTFGVTDSDTSDQEEEESDSDDAPLSRMVRRPGSALSSRPSRGSFSGSQPSKFSSSKSDSGYLSRKTSRKSVASATTPNPLVDLKAPSTMSPNSQPLPLPLVAKNKRPTLIQRASGVSGAAVTVETRAQQPLKSSMRPASRSAENLLTASSSPMNAGIMKNSSRAPSSILVSSASSTSGTTPATSIFSQPPSRPFARNGYGPYSSSPAGSSTGGSSTGKVPLTPRDGSDLGSMGGSGLNVPSSGRSALGVSSNAVARKGHSRKGSVTFEEPLSGKKEENEEERRKERRRSEARAAIQIGNALHGPLPDVDDTDSVYPNVPHMGMNMNMMGGGLGMQPGGWDAWSMVQQQQQAQQQLMMMSNMSAPNLHSPSPLLPLPAIPPGTDPVAFMNAHHAAMMYAKQAYQFAVAQQAMLAAGEEWERSSNIGGSVIGGYGGGGSTLGLGMPMMNPMGLNPMMIPSAAAGSVYGGSSVGGGMRGPSSVYGGSVAGSAVYPRGPASVSGRESDASHQQVHRRARLKNANASAPTLQAGKPQAGPPSSWRV